jgi:hypothetical protein
LARGDSRRCHVTGYCSDVHVLSSDELGQLRWRLVQRALQGYTERMHQDLAQQSVAEVPA